MHKNVGLIIYIRGSVRYSRREAQVVSLYENDNRKMRISIVVILVMIRKSEHREYLEEEWETKHQNLRSGGCAYVTATHSDSCDPTFWPGLSLAASITRRGGGIVDST